MINNGITNTLMLTNPVRRLLLPITQQRILLPLSEIYQSDYLQHLKPQPFSCYNKCDSLMKCLKIHNYEIKCLKDESLIRSISSSTYNVFKMTYNIQIKHYTYLESPILESIGYGINNENLEKYKPEIDVILYSLRDLKFEKEYGFFLKTPEKMLFFRNESMYFNEVYTNIKLIDLHKMKNNFF